MRLRAAAIAAVCVAALAAAGAAHAGSPARAIDYVALGDSVASGYGLSDAPSPCYRTAGSYPNRVLARLRTGSRPVRFRFLACAGATAANGEGMRSLQRQVDVTLRTLPARPTLVSLTIGINDLEWWNLPRLALLVREPEERFTAWLAGATDDVRTGIAAELRRLLGGPAVSIVVTGYFDPLNARSVFFQSPLVCPDVALCRSRAVRVIAGLNGAIRAAVRGAGHADRVRFAPVAAGFDSHRGARPRCGDAPPGKAGTWIQADCFHPNARGAAAIASAVARAARQLGL